MLYLVLQTSLLLALCSCVFFGIGWMARRWMDSRSDRRRAFAGESEVVEALQHTLKVLNGDLANRNAELESGQQRLVELESQLRSQQEQSDKLAREVAEVQTRHDGQQSRMESLIQRTVELESHLEAQGRSIAQERVSFTEEKEHWQEKIRALEEQLTLLAQEPEPPLSPQALPQPTLIPIEPMLAFEPEFPKPEPTPPLSAAVLERMERLEQQLGSDGMEQELKSRLVSLEETLQNMRAESEMALLAQLDFQSRTVETENEERRKWEDLEHEMELRIAQLELELSSMKQADMLISEISHQVEEKLKEQLAMLTTEVSEIKSTWTNQEVEFKSRDEQIIGNLDRLQSSLQKLGIRIEEDQASVPDSMLKEMEALKGDILASVPTATISPPIDDSARGLRDLRRRLEGTGGEVEKLLQEKDQTIRALARKLDPALVGNDDLKLIKGIGPYIARTLAQEFGISTFKEIAMLNPETTQKISQKLFFKNQIEREDWVGQAMKLHWKKYDERLENPRAPYPFRERF